MTERSQAGSFGSEKDRTDAKGGAGLHRGREMDSVILLL